MIAVTMLATAEGRRISEAKHKLRLSTAEVMRTKHKLRMLTAEVMRAQ